jgi:hypothetical protein
MLRCPEFYAQAAEPQHDESMNFRHSGSHGGAIAHGHEERDLIEWLWQYSHAADGRNGGSALDI